MKNRALKILATTAASFFSIVAQAQQVIEVGPTKTPDIRISRNANDMTRLAVYESGLSKIRFANGALSVTADPETKSAYIVPNVAGKIPAFIVTSSGQTHQVTFVVAEGVGSQSIVLREPKLEEGRAIASSSDPTAPRQIVERVDRASSYDVALKRLVRAMARGEAPADVTYTKVSRDFNLWQDTRFTLVAKYASRSYTGEHYRIQNLGAKPMRFDEREFYKKGVLAVSMEAHELAMGESSDIFIVRGAEVLDSARQPEGARDGS